MRVLKNVVLVLWELQLDKCVLPLEHMPMLHAWPRLYDLYFWLVVSSCDWQWCRVWLHCSLIGCRSSSNCWAWSSRCSSRSPLCCRHGRNNGGCINSWYNTRSECIRSSWTWENGTWPWNCKFIAPESTEFEFPVTLWFICLLHIFTWDKVNGLLMWGSCNLRPDTRFLQLGSQR